MIYFTPIWSISSAIWALPYLQEFEKSCPTALNIEINVFKVALNFRIGISILSLELLGENKFVGLDYDTYCNSSLVPGFWQVKEKTVAARRSGVKIVIFPSANKRDFLELPAHVKEGLEVHFVDHYSEIFTLAFDFKPDTDKQLAPVESGSASHDGVSVVLHL